MHTVAGETSHRSLKEAYKFVCDEREWLGPSEQAGAGERREKEDANESASELQPPSHLPIHSSVHDSFISDPSTILLLRCFSSCGARCSERVSEWRGSELGSNPLERVIDFLIIARQRRRSRNNDENSNRCKGAELDMRVGARMQMVGSMQREVTRKKSEDRWISQIEEKDAHS